MPRPNKLDMLDELRSQLAAAMEALREDRSKWSFDALVFVADRLLAEVYPCDVFPDIPDDERQDPGPRLARALRACRRAMESEAT